MVLVLGNIVNISNVPFALFLCIQPAHLKQRAYITVLYNYLNFEKAFNHQIRFIPFLQSYSACYG